MRVAERLGAIDRPGGRKRHSRPVLLLGGVAVFLAFFVSIGVFAAIFPQTFDVVWIDAHRVKAIVLACFMMLLLGIWDDLKALSPAQKLVFQVLIATIVYAAGIRIGGITNPFGGETIELDIISYPVSLLWIVGITNALNLIDGLDGLAAGVATVAALTIAAVSIIHGEMAPATVALVLAGSLLGFLRYNFYPARIFLGDSGSLFLGFLLAVLSLLISKKGSTAFALAIPVLALGLPIIDTLLAVARRFLKSFLPHRSRKERPAELLRSLFLPDLNHIHHRLIALGLTDRDAVLVLYVVCVAFGGGAVALSAMNQFAAMIIIIVASSVAVVGIWQLHYREMSLVSGGVLFSLYKRSPLRRRRFQLLGDLILAGISYASVVVLVDGFKVSTPYQEFAVRVGLVAGLQVFTCGILGFYEGNGRFHGIHDFPKMVTIICIAVLVGNGVPLFVGKYSPLLDTVTMILDFFVLFSFVLATGLLYRTLAYFTYHGRSRRQILIYGATPLGIAYLHRLITSSYHSHIPVGFLDDDPNLHGSQFHGYPVHGGIMSLKDVLRRINVDEILVASSHVDSAALKELRELNDSGKMPVRIVSNTSRGISLSDFPEQSNS